MTERTGSIHGQLMTADLEPIVGESVELLRAANATEGMSTQTDLQGRFTFNGMEPAPYRLHAAPACCEEVLREVVVQAGAVSEVSLLLDRVVSVLAYVVEEEWTGFIACGVGRYNLCPLDENHEPELHFFVEPGLRTIVVGLKWDPAGGVSSEELQLVLDRWQSPAFGYDYIAQQGVSPIVARADDASIDRGDAEFANITDVIELRYEVNAPVPGFVYQQAFTLYWQEYYHDPAPDDVDPVPDG